MVGSDKEAKGLSVKKLSTNNNQIQNNVHLPISITLKSIFGQHSHHYKRKDSLNILLWQSLCIKKIIKKKYNFT